MIRFDSKDGEEKDTTKEVIHFLINEISKNKSYCVSLEGYSGLYLLNFCNGLIFVGECKAVLTMPCSYDSNASQKISQK